MPSSNQKGFAHIFVLLILLLAIPIGVYLAQHPQIFKPKAAVSETGEIQWINQKYTIGGSGSYSTNSYESSNLRSLDEDVVITGIKIDLTGMHPGMSVQEFCGDFFRDTPPKYEAVIAGYSEFICWGFTKLPEQPTDWHTFVDLTDTPLYFPKNSKVTFAANAAYFDDTNIQNLSLSITLKYKKYHPGDPRYRSLRLPYADQMDDYTSSGPVGVATPVYYTPEKSKNLHIKGAYLYPQPLTRYDSSYTQTACLRWLRQGGVIVDQKCFFNNQVIGPSSTHYQPQKLSFDWNIPFPDLLSNYCASNRPEVDCAIWAFAEIPNTIPDGPEAIFRDFNNVPRSFLKKYCQSQVKTQDYPYGYLHNYFCDGQPNCLDELKIDICTHRLFPYASCDSGQTCQSIYTNPPEEWNMGETKTYQLKVTNNTQEIMPSGGPNPVNVVVYINKEAGSSSDNNDSISNYQSSFRKYTISLPQDLQPNQSAMVQVTVQAPDNPGYYILHHQLIKQGVRFFDEIIKTTMTVYNPNAPIQPPTSPIRPPRPIPAPSLTPISNLPLNAQYQVGNIPQTVLPNENLAYPVTVKNIGTQIWKSTGPDQTNLIAFIGNENSTWANSQTRSTGILLPYDLSPGQSVTLQVNLKTPTTQGNYYLINQMVKQGVAFFDQTSKNTLTVQIPFSQPREANYSVTPQTTSASNSNLSLPVTIKNQGNQTWLANSPTTNSALNEVQLIVYISTTNTNDPALYASAIKQQTIKLPHDVGPNETINLTVNIPAPSTPANYYIHYRMIEQGVAWFNQYAITNLTIQ